MAVMEKKRKKSTKKLPKLLYDCRVSHNLTQREVAEVCGVTEQAVSQWEQGLWRPSPRNIPKLEELFETDLKTAYFLS
ncbi:MAG: helix-turn-helix transcriptional regulator [Candidatus Auribacterota bacterium]|jgi:transcriptional regulator with XRE-family HTH domain|uniref:XRE family transcriptional regulator n=1 Tax=Candidatus Auribacter fodinae TaxID=2093366 RepID=A0A3A4R9G8_9BACT|nr:MAG: XRE family transcriptional regulator [Candidatus Auribacter fodinae]